MHWNMICYCEVRDTIAAEISPGSREQQRQLQSWMCLASLALVAERNNYVRPKINEKGVIDIQRRATSGGGKDDPE